MRMQLQMLIHRRPSSGTALAALIGLCAFGLAFTFLRFDGFGLFRPVPAPAAQNLNTPAAATLLPSVTVPSTTAQIGTGHMAIGVRLKPDNAPLASLQVGAVLDVLASLPDGPAGPGVVGPAITGARVIALATSADHADVLLEAPAPAAMLLAYLVRSGSPLTYVVRGAAGAAEGAFSVLTMDDARARLGLPLRIMPQLPPPLAAPVAPLAAPVAPPTTPVAAVAPELSEVHFIVYPGVDLGIVERRFDVTDAALSAANPAVALSEPLVPGTELVVPDLYGFYYRVQPGDTFASVAQRFHLSVERLQRVNDLLSTNGVPIGLGLLIPVG